MFAAVKNDNRLRPDTVIARLRQLLETKRLGGADEAKVRTLLSLFDRMDAMPEDRVMTALFPDAAIDKRPAAFRAFRARLKKAANSERVSVELSIDQKARKGSRSKTCWFAGAPSVKDELPERFIQPELAATNRDYNWSLFQNNQQARIKSSAPPGLTYPQTLSAFFGKIAPREWESLPPRCRTFLCSLSVKLEPFIQLIPQVDQNATRGFEMTAYGPTGDSFYVIDTWLHNQGVPPAFCRAALLIVGLRFIADLRAWWQAEGHNSAASRIFTINVDSILLHSDLLRPALDRFMPAGGNVLLEVNERTRPEETRLYKNLLADYPDLGLALDDGNDAERKVKIDLASNLRLIKVDAKTTREIFDNRADNPGAVIAELGMYRRQGIPLVVEGIENKPMENFLLKQWPAEYGELWLQGWSLQPSEPWRIWLSPVRQNPEEPRGFIVSRAPEGPVLQLPLVHEVSTMLTRNNLAHEYLGRRGEIVILQVKLPDNACWQIGIIEQPCEFNAEIEHDFTGLWPIVAPTGLQGRSGHCLDLPGLERHIMGWRQISPLAENLHNDDYRKFYDPERYIGQCGITGRLKSLFSEQTSCATTGTDNSGRQEALPLLERWLNDDQHPFCALLGDYGIGKTFLCRMLARRLLEMRRDNPELPFPLYIDMRRVPTYTDNRVPTLEEMIGEVLRKGGITDLEPGLLISLARRGDLLVIFDGLDEKTVHLEPSQAGELIEQLHRLLPGAAAPDPIQLTNADQPTPKSKRPSGKTVTGKLLIACRTHYFRDIYQQANLLTGGNRSGLRPDDYLLVSLQPFQEEQIKTYLSGILGEQGMVEAWQMIQGIHKLSDLAERPYLLSLIAEHVNDLKRRIDAGLQVNAASLYEEIVTAWLGRDEGKHKLNKRHKPLFMEALAAKFWAEQRQSLGVDDLDDWVDLEVDQKYRANYQNMLVARLEDDVRTATFLVRSDENTFRFAHTSLQEFFLARHIVRGLGQGRAEILDLPLLSLETREFVIGLLQEPWVNATVFASTLVAVIASPYLEKLSENALALWIVCRRNGQPLPEPAAILLTGARLSGWDLTGLDLAVADLSGADLSRAVLNGTNLANANLCGADLSHAELGKTCLTNAQMQNAVLIGSHWQDVEAGGAVLTASDLRGAEFIRCNLEQADLTGADLLNAALARCRLVEADLGGTCLQNTAFGGCELQGAHPPTLIESPEVRDSLRAHEGRIQPYTGHANRVASIAFAPNGKTIASGSGDQSIRIWDTASGRLLNILQGHENGVRSVAFAPDGKTIASGSDDKSIRIWDATSGRLLNTLQGHENWVRSVAFSPDGKAIASGSSDKLIRIWDAASGQLLNTLQGHENWVWSVAFSPDGKTIASGSDDKLIQIWDVASGQLRNTLQGHENGVRSVAFSPDGKTIASGSYDKSIRVWDAASGRLLHTLQGHKNGVRSVAFSPDGEKIASGSYDQSIYIWNAVTGRLLNALQGHENRVLSVAFSPDGGKIASGSDDKSIRIWDAVSGQLFNTLQEHENRVLSVVFSPDGKSISSGSDDKSIRIWDATAGQLLNTLQEHENLVWSVTFSPDGKTIASGSDDKSIRTWDAASGRLLNTLQGHGSGVLSVAFSPDGKTIASGSYGKSILIWDAISGQLLNVLQGHESWVWSVAFSPDGKTIASGSDDMSIRIWDAASGRLLNTLQGHEDGVLFVAFAPDGKTIASGSSDKSIRIWDAASERLLNTLHGHENEVWSVAFSPDGKTIASGSFDKSIRIWDAASGRLLNTLHGHENEVWSVAFSSDGKTIASGSSDKSIRIWDAASGLPEYTIYLLPDNEWAACQTDRITSCSPRAGRYMGYGIGLARFPAEAFYDLPVVRDELTILANAELSVA